MEQTLSDRHKRRVIGLFDRIAGGFDNPSQRFFPFAGDRLANRLQPKPGDKVLDVATGTGAVAVGLAQAARNGRVFAIELSEPMLDRAVANVRKMALDNVDFHNMDAEQLEFRNGYFDGVACGLAIFLFPDPAKAVAEWLRILRPGGRAAFSAFGEGAFSGLFDDLAARLDATGTPVESGWFRRMAPEECVELLTSGGFVEAEVETAQVGYHLANAVDWWEVVEHTSLAALVDSLPAEQRESMRKDHLRAVEKLMGEEGLRVDVEVHLTRGRRP